MAELTKELDRGVERALKCDDALADILLRKLAETRRERDRLAAELADQEPSRRKSDIDAEADAVLAELNQLSTGLNEKDDPGTIRDVLQRMVTRIDLTFDHIPRGKRIECPMSKGTIHLRQDLNIYTLKSRGDRRFTFPNESLNLQLLWSAIAQTIDLPADAFERAS